jgi:hypothetical protein
MPKRFEHSPGQQLVYRSLKMKVKEIFNLFEKRNFRIGEAERDNKFVTEETDINFSVEFAEGDIFSTNSA